MAYHYHVHYHFSDHHHNHNHMPQLEPKGEFFIETTGIAVHWFNGRCQRDYHNGTICIQTFSRFHTEPSPHNNDSIADTTTTTAAASVEAMTTIWV